MSRPRIELDQRYGKLTVVSDLGGSNTLVRCDCGEQKWVLRTNLRAGRIQSCGRPGCRVYTSGQTPRVLNESDRAPTWLPTDAIPGLYARAQEPGEVTVLADELRVSATTIYKLMADVRDRGGIEAYMEYVSDAETTVPTPAVTIAVKPGEVCAPPQLYDPANNH